TPDPDQELATTLKCHAAHVARRPTNSTGSHLACRTLRCRRLGKRGRTRTSRTGTASGGIAHPPRDGTRSAHCGLQPKLPLVAELKADNLDRRRDGQHVWRRVRKREIQIFLIPSPAVPSHPEEVAGRRHDKPSRKLCRLSTEQI